MGEPIRTGLVGFGVSGRTFHAPFLATHARLRLTHIVQRHGTDAAERWPGVVVVNDIEELLSVDPPVALVVIATPNATHFELARRAIQARRHVVIDKPMTVTTQEAAALIDLARSAGTLLVPYHNRRWDGDFVTVQALLQRGWLGELRHFESRFDRLRPQLRPGAWREQSGPGAGLLYDLGSHLVDQTLVLFGNPLAVSATILIERPGASVDDRFEIALDYGHFSVRLGAGMLFDPPGARFRISGSRGNYVKHGVDPQEEPLRAGRAPGGNDWGEEPPERWGAISVAMDGLEIDGRLRTRRGDYRGFYDHLCDVLEGRCPLTITAEQGAEVIRVIEKALESSRASGATLPY